MAIDAGRLRDYSALVAARQASIFNLERKLLDANDQLYCHISDLCSYILQCANVPAEVATAHGATAESPPGRRSIDAERMHSYLVKMQNRQASISELIQKLHDENARLHADITGLNEYIHECECVPAEVATARSTTFTTAESLPPGWRSAIDKLTGWRYYWNSEDKVTTGQWYAPVPHNHSEHTVSSSTIEHGVSRPDNPTATQLQDAAPSAVSDVQSQGTVSSSATEHGHFATNGPDDPIPAMPTWPAFLSQIRRVLMDRVPMPDVADAPGWGCTTPELYIYVYASKVHNRGFETLETIRLDRTEFRPHLNDGLGRCDGRNPQMFLRMLPGQEFHIIREQWRQATKFIRTSFSGMISSVPVPMGVLCHHGRHRSMGFAWILSQWCRHYHGPVQIWSVRSKNRCQLCPSRTNVCCRSLHQLTSENLAVLHKEAR